jgi:hypothetical protein
LISIQWVAAKYTTGNSPLSLRERVRVRGPRAGVPCRVIELPDVSLNHIDARIGPLTVAFEDIIVGAMILIGPGLSFMVQPERVRS